MHSSGPPTRRPRLLAIDDDPSLRELYSDAFGADGFDVTTAANGAEGMAQLDSHPDVILLDLMMPVMDGFTFLTALHNSKFDGSIPVVVVSAVPPSDHIRGAERVIPKPFDIDRVSGILLAYATPSTGPVRNQAAGVPSRSTD